KHEFSVDMTCEACANAVTHILSKLGGKVCITSEQSVDTLLETLEKTGKAVSYLGPSQRGPGCPTCGIDPLPSSGQI
ncbi:hypothetical protein FD755_017116, partial [Muntiacus reevesi]